MNTPKNKNLQRLSLEKKACKENEALQNEILNEIAKSWEYKNWQKVEEAARLEDLGIITIGSIENVISIAVAHTLSRATAEILKEVEKMKKVSMICSICGEEDKSKTAYCEKHHRSPHLLIEVVDMQDIRRRLRTQSGSFSLPKEKLAKENKDGGGK
ncbi:MAG TPA: hypothetical protein VMV95_03020 [Bacillota bacterium]|nr:hypothetical protein [Bacillota bacterium]